MFEFDSYEDSRRVFREHILQRTDPYSLWVVLDQKGRPVKGIDGTFTNVQDAAKALDNLLNKKKVP